MTNNLQQQLKEMFERRKVKQMEDDTGDGNVYPYIYMYGTIEEIEKEFTTIITKSVVEEIEKIILKQYAGRVHNIQNGEVWILRSELNKDIKDYAKSKGIDLTTNK